MKIRKQFTVLAISAAVAAASFGAFSVSAATSSTTNAADENTLQTTATHKREAPKDFLQELVDKGTLSEDTAKKIESYMEEHKPDNMQEKNMKQFGNRDNAGNKADGRHAQRPSNAEGDETTPPEKPTNADGSEMTPPADGKAFGHHGPMGMGVMRSPEELLEELLKNNIITEKEYNAIKSAIPERPEQKKQ